VEVRVRGAAADVESVVGFDVETLQTTPVSVARDGADLRLTVDSRWFVIVLRKAGCRGLVSFGGPGPMKPGQRVELDLGIVSPDGDAAPAAATFSAPGLGLRREVRVPGSITFEVPKDTPPGKYRMTLEGPGVLGHKRFVEVTAS